MTNTYDIGDVVDMTATFTNPTSGTVVDPGTVVCTVLSSDGETTSTPAASKVSTGVYIAAVQPDRAGTWWYAFDGTGSVRASGEQEFLVRTKRVPR